jgi:SsrA-binding protein
MYIAQNNLFDSADTRRERKLLLTRQEILKIKNKMIKNMTLVPVEVFLDNHNRAKIDIALAKGKKNYDKRRSIKERDEKRRIAREKD